jgi:hypothetical protein
LSGPAILQISSYWNPGDKITINLLPDINLAKKLGMIRETAPAKKLKPLLSQLLPKRLIASLIDERLLASDLQQLSKQDMVRTSETLQNWQIIPNGTEGYRTAEVTLGGVDCDAISSKTMEAKSASGLYFIGEVVDVTGWLGGYNFQWAWASGWCAGQYV